MAAEGFVICAAVPALGFGVVKFLINATNYCVGKAALSQLAVFDETRFWETDLHETENLHNKLYEVQNKDLVGRGGGGGCFLFFFFLGLLLLLLLFICLFLFLFFQISTSPSRSTVVYANNALAFSICNMNKSCSSNVRL